MSEKFTKIQVIFSMKKTIGLLMLLASFTAHGQQYDNERDFKTEKTSDGKSVVIMGYLGKNTTINIPPQIQEMPVIGIGKDAFNNKNLTGVTIPDSVVSIGQAAFAFNKITSITIPNSVTTIERGAFSNNQINSAIISNNLTSININVFRNNQLTSVTIPNRVTSIGGSSFLDNKLTSVTLGNNITTIGDYAFSNNQLTSVNIPNSVTSIGKSAFSNNKLDSVTLGKSITTIGDNAFRNNQLTSITIPNSVSHIGYMAFAENLFVTIPKTGRANVDQTAFSFQFQQTQKQDNLSKLTGNLAGGLNLLGSFTRGEKVNIPQMFLRAVDLTIVGNEFHYLVAVNDRQWANRLSPFYIISNRRFNMMDFDFPNTIIESFSIEFVDYGVYIQNRVQSRETYIFRIIN